MYRIVEDHVEDYFFDTEFFVEEKMEDTNWYRTGFSGQTFDEAMGYVEELKKRDRAIRKRLEDFKNKILPRVCWTE